MSENTTAIAFDTDMLTDLIRAKLECLLQIREMGLKQRSLIDEGNLTGLLELLTVKQRPLLQLQRIERALDPYRKQDPEKREWRTQEDRARCAESLQKCESVLAEVINQEKFCEATLIRRRDETAEQLKAVHWAGSTRDAYTAKSPAALHQLDLSTDT